MAFQFPLTAFRFSSTAFHFSRNLRKSIYGKKYTKDCYSSFVFFATCSPSFVITDKHYLRDYPTPPWPPSWICWSRLRWWLSCLLLVRHCWGQGWLTFHGLPRQGCIFVSGCAQYPSWARWYRRACIALICFWVGSTVQSCWWPESGWWRGRWRPSLPWCCC